MPASAENHLATGGRLRGKRAGASGLLAAQAPEQAGGLCRLGRLRRRVRSDVGKARRQACIDEIGHVGHGHRSEEHTSDLQSLMRISYAGLCLKKKTKTNRKHTAATNSRLNRDKQH